MSDMNTKSARPAENKMGVMPIGKLLATMAIPMMVSMLFQAFYNVVDSIFVSRVSQDALNSVSLAFPLQNMMIAFGGGTGVGMSALLSKSLGAKDQESADRAANVGIFLFICTSIMFACIGILLSGAFFRVQTSNETIIRYGTQYTTICLGCSIGLFMQFCNERLLQSTGRTFNAMITQLTGAIINMILDPIFIFGYFGFPRMEVAGAAVATVTGQMIAAIMAILMNIKTNKEIHLSVKKIRFHKETTLRIYRVGLPSIIMMSIGSIMTFFLNKILIGFTEAATAVYGAYFKLQSFIFMPIFGMNNAMVPIVAYNYGAKKHDRVKNTVKLTILTAMSIMAVGTCLFEFFPGLLLGFFNPSEEMLRIGIVALRIIGVHFIIAGFCIVAGSVCQAIGNPMHSMVISITRQLLVLLPVAFLLSLTGNLDLVWLAFPIAEIVSLILSAFFLKKTLKKAAMS